MREEEEKGNGKTGGVVNMCSATRPQSLKCGSNCEFIIVKRNNHQMCRTAGNLSLKESRNKITISINRNKNEQLLKYIYILILFKILP